MVPILLCFSSREIIAHPTRNGAIQSELYEGGSTTVTVHGESYQQKLLAPILHNVLELVSVKIKGTIEILKENNAF